MHKYLAKSDCVSPCEGIDAALENAASILLLCLWTESRPLIYESALMAFWIRRVTFGSCDVPVVIAAMKSSS